MNVYRVVIAEVGEEFVTARTMAEAWDFMVNETGRDGDHINSIERLGSVWLGPMDE